MGISLHLQALQKTKWWEFALRFIFGGAISVIAAILAEQFGPAFGGLFLAFPAIFPATATLVEKHERQKKAKAGILASQRGRQSAALDAAGAALGSIGLFGFAIIVWKFLPGHNTGLVLVAATTAWLALSVMTWHIRRRHWRKISS